MQRYLNRQDQDGLITIVATVISLEEIRNNWVKTNKPREVIDYLTDSKILLESIVDYYQNSLDKAEQERVFNKSKQYLVKLVPTVQAKKSYEEKLTMEQNTVMLTEDWYDILAVLLPSICNNCQKVGDDEAKCNIRRILMHYNVPAFDLETTGCTYKSCRDFLEGAGGAVATHKYAIGDPVTWVNTLGNLMIGRVVDYRKTGYRVRVSGKATEITIKFKQIVEVTKCGRGD